jgi:hypothetical protein
VIVTCIIHHNHFKSSTRNPWQVAFNFFEATTDLVCNISNRKNDGNGSVDDVHSCTRSGFSFFTSPTHEVGGEDQTSSGRQNHCKKRQVSLRFDTRITGKSLKPAVETLVV